MARDWKDCMELDDRIIEAHKLIGVYEFWVRGIPRPIKITVKESHNGWYSAMTDCSIQSPGQAWPYRHSNPSDTAHNALVNAISGILHFLPKDPEKLVKTRVIFDDGEECMCQIED